MPSSKFEIDIVLTDDDRDDCLLFKDALEEFNAPTRLRTLHNGDELMTYLCKTEFLPDILFLDLNMPRKNGYECLIEIKESVKLSQLPVVIFSTSAEPKIVDLVYNKGAAYYICKPNEYSRLVSVIHHVITILMRPFGGEGELSQPPMKDFVLSPEMCYNEAKK